MVHYNAFEDQEADGWNTWLVLSQKIQNDSTIGNL
jgi:hypothetical protein